MKLKAILVVVFVAGLAASLAFAAAPKAGKPGKHTTATGSTTTTTSKKPQCQQVELKGNGATGSVSFTVLKANKRGRSLVGTSVTLSIPAGAKVKAKACTGEGDALTLRDLHVKAKPAK
jgi:hypothetical protein